MQTYNGVAILKPIFKTMTTLKDLSKQRLHHIIIYEKFCQFYKKGFTLKCFFKQAHLIYCLALLINKKKIIFLYSLFPYYLF